MFGDLKIGRVAGIQIRLHASWFIIFALLTWSLAAGFFPEEYPGLATGGYLLLAVATSLLFFGSVLAHELGHSLVAQREGISVSSITLFIFGGVAKLTRESRAPGAEFRIAIAGPAVSLILAGFFLAAWALDHLMSPYLAAPSSWLMRINLSLALFNMIPGFPLDGGRVLRAILWKVTGDPNRSLRIASVIGQVTAFGFIGWGIVTALTGNLPSGLWLAAIGWFLQNAAAASLDQASLRQVLRGASVSEIMNTSNDVFVAGDLPIRELVNRVLAGGPRCFFVRDEGHMRGLVTLTDIVQIPQDRWGRVMVKEIMVPWDRVLQIEAGTPLPEALEKMDQANVSQLPVVDGQLLLGVLSRERVLHHIRLRSELRMI